MAGTRFEPRETGVGRATCKEYPRSLFRVILTDIRVTLYIEMMKDWNEGKDNSIS